MSSGVSFGYEKAKILLKVQNSKCAYCPTLIAVGKKRRGLALCTLDHVIPRTYGGSDDIGNLLASCVPCNAAKGGRLPNATEIEILGTIAPEAVKLWQHLKGKQP